MLMKDLGRQTLIHGNKVPVEEMCAKIDSLTLEVRHLSSQEEQQADEKDIWRVAMRVLKPTSKSAVLNYGLGAGGPTIVAQGPNLAALGDVKSTLRKWGVGR